jgi:hypothetical protein
LPTEKGCGIVTHDTRNGTTTLFAALDVLNGEVISQCMPRDRHQEFLKFSSPSPASHPDIWTSTASPITSAHVLPLILMLSGDGRTLDDLRVLRVDEVLKKMPSIDATGDWLRCMGTKGSDGLAGLQRANRTTSTGRGLWRKSVLPTTLTSTRKVTRRSSGMSPISSASGNLQFLQACEDVMPKGNRIEAIRADNAAYQAAIFNWCDSSRSARLRMRR